MCSLLPALWEGLRRWLPTEASLSAPNCQLGLPGFGEGLSDLTHPFWPAD